MNYRIDLAPSGNLRLWYTEHTGVEIPATLAGVHALKEILASAQLGKTKVAQAGAPTQAAIDQFINEWRTKNPSPPDLINWDDIDI
jgi:hypothetical protein